MTAVSPEDRDAMTRLLEIMNGKTPSVKAPSTTISESRQVELAGPGVPTQADIDAMSNILSKIKNVNTSGTVKILNENSDREFAEAIQTERLPGGVNVGRYQIMIKENTKRLAGKQYYSIYNSLTNDVIADDLSLYETALSAVRLLNNGKFTNCKEIRKLFEQDDIYTAHRVDALMYKHRLGKTTDPVKQDIYESRYQSSIDKAMAAKRQIKQLSNAR